MICYHQVRKIQHNLTFHHRHLEFMSHMGRCLTFAVTWHYPQAAKNDGLGKQEVYGFSVRAQREICGIAAVKNTVSSDDDLIMLHYPADGSIITVFCFFTDARAACV